MLSKLHEKIAGNLMVLFLSYNGSLGGLPRLSSRLLIVVTQMNPSEFKRVRYMPKALGSTSGEKLDTQDTPKSQQEIPRRSPGDLQETPGDPQVISIPWRTSSLWDLERGGPGEFVIFYGFRGFLVDPKTVKNSHSG